MKQPKYLVDVLDTAGRVIGQKPRYQIDKRVDVVHAVHVVLYTPEGDVVLSHIPQREDLPNLYAGLLGTTMATLRRHGETAEVALRRDMNRELLLENPDIELIYDAMSTLSDWKRMYLTAYALVADLPGMYSNLKVGELLLMNPDGVEMALALHPDRFAPTFTAVWPNLKVWTSQHSSR